MTTPILPDFAARAAAPSFGHGHALQIHFETLPSPHCQICGDETGFLAPGRGVFCERHKQAFGRNSIRRSLSHRFRILKKKIRVNPVIFIGTRLKEAP